MSSTRRRSPAATRKSSSAPDRTQDVKPQHVPGSLTAKLRIPAAAALLLVLAVLPYANSLDNGFVWDDHQQVVMNSALRPDSPFRHLFQVKIWGFALQGIRQPTNYYRPLQMVAYRLTADRFGFDPRAFHAVNLTFHMFAVLLVFALFRKLTNSIGVAFAAAALFAAHPVHSEAVDWIAALPDISCTVFFLLAILLFGLTRKDATQPQQIEQPRVTRLLLLSASCAAFAAALLWKESAIVLPLIVMVRLLYLGEAGTFARRLREALQHSLPFWAILGAYFFLRLRVLGFIAARSRNWVLTPVELVLTTLNLLLNYWLKLLAPTHLNAYYVFSPVMPLHDLRAIAAILFLIAAAGGIVYGARRAPLAAFAALWVCITLIPVLNVYAVGRNVFAERYLYLPSVGFCLLMVLVAAWVGRRLPVRFRLPVAAVALASVLTWFIAQNIARNPVWKDDSALFVQTLESSPDAPFVQNMVASVQPNDAKGQAAAEAHYLRAVSLAENEAPPDRLEIVMANEGLASIYANRGNFDRALSALDEVRAAYPESPQVDGEEGLILAQAGRWTQAEAALRKAVAIQPNDANVLNALGLVAWQHNHDLARAADYFSRALAVHTDTDDFRASLLSNFGAVYGEQGRFSDAIAQFQLALQVVPNDPAYLTNLGTAFAAVGRLNEARAQLHAALAVAPDYEPARAALQQLSRR
jgi:protein O-mannosyl-transferase